MIDECLFRFVPARGSGSTWRFRRLSDMGRILLIALLLAVTVSDADARRRHHRHWRGAPVMMISPDMNMPREMRGYDAPREARGSSSFIPADWKLQPEDPNFSGRRYMASDGSAWLALYSAPAKKEEIAAHLKSVAFADGEEITYIRGARDWLAVSGLKGDRVYYRKAALACGGTTWRHIAFEYPAEQKPALDRVVERAAQAFDRLAEESCSGDLFTHPKS
jgi:serine/threonine-protein kinase